MYVARTHMKVSFTYTRVYSHMYVARDHVAVTFTYTCVYSHMYVAHTHMEVTYVTLTHSTNLRSLALASSSLETMIHQRLMLPLTPCLLALVLRGFHFAILALALTYDTHVKKIVSHTKRDL